MDNNLMFDLIARLKALDVELIEHKSNVTALVEKLDTLIQEHQLVISEMERVTGYPPKHPANLTHKPHPQKSFQADIKFSPFDTPIVQLDPAE